MSYGAKILAAGGYRGQNPKLGRDWGGQNPVKGNVGTKDGKGVSWVLGITTDNSKPGTYGSVEEKRGFKRDDHT